MCSFNFYNNRLGSNENTFIKIKLMVLSVAGALTPCIMRKCSVETKDKQKERYRYTKKYGIYTCRIC